MDIRRPHAAAPQDSAGVGGNPSFNFYQLPTMSLFRRETTKTWLQSIAVGLPLLWLGLTIAIYHHAGAGLQTFIAAAAFLLSSVIGFRFFQNAEDMFIEVFDDRIEWLCFMATPREATIQLNQVEELIIFQTKSRESRGASALLSLADGRVLPIPNPTGSVLPILKAIRKARPGLKESLRIGHSPAHRKALINLILGKQPPSN